MAQTAFVTGGSGFVGGRLIRRLAGEDWTVQALARSDRSAAAVERLGAEAVSGELGNASAIAAGAEGCEFAFHLAAHVADSGPWEDFERVNVQGTRNALAGCSEAGVRRFVHCGTEAALMAGDPLVQVDETAPLRPDSSAPYPATKARAEQAVLAANTEAMETVVLRPRFVWGAGDTTLLPEMVKMVEAGRFAWIGGGEHLTSTTHVDNVVEGLMLAADKGRPGNAYFVTDGDDVVFREFVSEMLRTQDVEPPGRNLPKPVAGAIVGISETAWRFLPLPGSPPLSRFTYWVLTQECTIDISKARSELGYQPPLSRDQGLAGLRASTAPRPLAEPQQGQ